MDLIFTFLLRFSVIKVRIKGDMQEDFNKSDCRHIRKRMDVNQAYKNEVKKKKKVTIETLEHTERFKLYFSKGKYLNKE